MKKILFAMVCMWLCGCSNDLNMFLPEGPQGEPGKDGKSAYEVWVEAVENDIVEWDESTDMSGFFRYLKGKDGKDGENGKDGINGKSAYELWLEEVAKGVEDPHNPGQEWDKDATRVSDFFRFLTGEDGADGKPGKDGTDGKDGNNGTSGGNGTSGKDGLSAYELWKKEVAKGLDDPHNPGNKWPAGEVDLEDFWRYLRGDDGEDGLPGGNTGLPGADIDTIAGVPNVIPRYVSKEHNEFVRVQDGGVDYTVFDDSGNPAVGAKVKGLPGVKDPDKEYTSGAGGFLFVPKEDLPDVKELANRRGTAQVKYAGGTGFKESAPTYVPNRMHVRLRLQVDPVLDGVYMKFMPIVERKTDGGAWQTIPNYLSELESQSIFAYEVDKSDPASYLPTKYKVTYGTDHAATGLNLSKEDIQLNVNRLRKAATYFPDPIDKWDGNERYFTLVLESYYGEKPQAPVMVQMAPIQAMPMIKNVSTKTHATDGMNEWFTYIDGEFDIAGAAIDNTLLFQTALDEQSKTIGATVYACYSPVIESNASVYGGAKQFIVRFQFTSHNMSNSGNKGSINVSPFHITTPYLGARVVLECDGAGGSDAPYFYSLNSIGHLKCNTPGDWSTLVIDCGYDAVFTEIPVGYTP
jgi:hypothetical protein